MPQRRHKSEEIVAKLRRFDVLASQGGRPFYNGKPLQAAGADVTVDRGVDGGIK